VDGESREKRTTACLLKTTKRNSSQLLEEDDNSNFQSCCTSISSCRGRLVPPIFNPVSYKEKVDCDHISLFFRAQQAMFLALTLLWRSGSAFYGCILAKIADSSATKQTISCLVDCVSPF
jgi:hypothetical protein